MKVLRRCIGSYAGMRCAGHVEVVLVGPQGNRFGKCRDCAERDLAEYSRTEPGWHIEAATEDEQTMEAGA